MIHATNREVMQVGYRSARETPIEYVSAALQREIEKALPVEIHDCHVEQDHEWDGYRVDLRYTARPIPISMRELVEIVQQIDPMNCSARTVEYLIREELIRRGSYH